MEFVWGTCVGTGVDGRGSIGPAGGGANNRGKKRSRQKPLRSSREKAKRGQKAVRSLEGEPNPKHLDNNPFVGKPPITSTINSVTVGGSRSACCSLLPSGINQKTRHPRYKKGPSGRRDTKRHDRVHIRLEKISVFWSILGTLLQKQG